jgi:hypothetical protein
MDKIVEIAAKKSLKSSKIALMPSKVSIMEKRPELSAIWAVSVFMSLKTLLQVKKE